MYKETKIAGLNAVVYSPDTSKQYPTVVFFPGLGEDGTDMNLLYRNGPASFIKNGYSPDFNIVCVQPTYGWIKPYITTNILNGIRQILGVSSFHLTGLSAGAASIFDYISLTPNHGISSIVVFSYAPVANQREWHEYPATWALTGDRDSYTNVLTLMVDSIKKLGTEAKLTVYSGGHSGWNTFYNPTWKQDGQNIYEWMVSHDTSPTPTPATTTTSSTTSTTTTSSKTLVATIKVYSDGSVEKL